jgi:hypothetical protein
MSNMIVRPIADDLGFDEFGQFCAKSHENGSTVMQHITDLRMHTCAICGKPWEVTAKAMLNQQRVLETWVHRTCYLGYLGIKEANFWSQALCEVRPAVRAEDPLGTLIFFDWERIPNQYGGGYDTPWYIVRFSVRRKGYKDRRFTSWLKVGSRRRVYQMSMHDLTAKQVNAWKIAVEKEEVTKTASTSEVMIHAHGEEAAKRYLKIVYDLLDIDFEWWRGVPDGTDPKAKDVFPDTRVLADIK